MKGRSFSADFLDKTTINVTLCSELKEQIDEEGVSNENCLEETNKTVAAL